MKAKVLFEYEKSGGSFLDVEHVNSAVRWTIEVKVKEGYDHAAKALTGKTDLHASVTVSLSDCNRWISWDGYAHESHHELDAMMDKINNAISQLKEVKYHLIHAQRGIAKHHVKDSDNEV